MARCKNLLTLYKIRNAATYKVKDDVRNAISNAVANSARSDLGKKGKDPDQHLDKAEQVTFEAKKTDLCMLTQNRFWTKPIKPGCKFLAIDLMLLKRQFTTSRGQCKVTCYGGLQILFMVNTFFLQLTLELLLL